MINKAILCTGDSRVAGNSSWRKLRVNVEETLNIFLLMSNRKHFPERSVLEELEVILTS